jgi:hypothetical protein
MISAAEPTNVGEPEKNGRPFPASSQPRSAAGRREERPLLLAVSEKTKSRSLSKWRDRAATASFVICVGAAFVLVVAVIAGMLPSLGLAVYSIIQVSTLVDQWIEEKFSKTIVSSVSTTVRLGSTKYLTLSERSRQKLGAGTPSDRPAA